MRVDWTEGSLEDLAALYDRLAEFSGKQAAIRRLRRVQTSVNLLRSTPEIGRLSSFPGVRELVVPGTPQIIGYRVRETHLEILGIREAKEEFPSGGLWG